jgi:spermidine synthase
MIEVQNAELSPPTDNSSLMVKVALALLGALFLVSGFSALIVEQVFEKLLLTVVGSATGSASIVLSVFFGGLTTGGLLYARFGARAPKPLWVILGLELAVAVSGLTLALGFGPIQTASESWISRAGSTPWLVFTLRVLIAILWMAIPTVAMGGTYPAMVKILGHPRLPRGSWVPTLFYGINLLGAVLGGFLGPYAFFPSLGLAATLIVACSLQAVVSTLVIFICNTIVKESGPNDENVGATIFPLPPEQKRLLLLALYSGFLVFSLEVVWYHLIGAVLGMSAYAFATMLCVVLLALFLGSSLSTALPERWSQSPLAVPLSLLFTGALLTLTTSAWPETPELLHDQGYAIRDFASAEWLRFKFALFLVGLPAFGAGTLYPFLLRSKTIPPDSRARFISLLGVANALGCILGALLSGFVLIERLGAEHTLSALTTSACLFSLLGLFGFREKVPAFPRYALLGAAFAIFSLAWIAKPWDRLALTSGIHVYFKPMHVTRDSRLLFFHEDTHGGFVTVVAREFPGGVLRTLLTNGKFQGNDGGEVVAQTALAALPCLAVQKRNEALVIGLGTGQSARVVRDAGFRQVDVAEIAPGIVEAASSEFSHLNGKILEQPGVQLIVEDGRNHLLRSQKLYDLISMEISSIWFAGATNLYSREYYRLTRAHLASDGVLQQWIQLHHIDPIEVASVLKTVRSVFPFVELWFVGGQGIILASAHPLHFTPPSEETKLPTQFQTRLAEVRNSPALATSLWEGRALGPEAPSAMLRDPKVPVNTDESRWLEFSTPRHLFSPRSAEHLLGELLKYESSSERDEVRRRLHLKTP